MDNVIAELKEIIQDFGIKHIRIADDNFTANKKRMFRFCEKVADLEIKYRISIRVKPLTIEMLTALKQSGCVEVSLGIESFDDKVLNGLKKGAFAKDNIKAIENCGKVGISARALMMINTPFQNRQTIKKNIEKCFQLRYIIGVVTCTFFVPLPGSDIYENPAKYNIKIIDRNFDNYNFYAWGPEGERKHKDVFVRTDRNMDEIHAENQEFIDFLKDTRKLNKG